MPLNKITADSITDGTVVASDIADGTITLAKLQSGLLPPATANSAAAYANSAFATANTGSASGSYANSAFATANTGSASGSYANSAFSVANNSLGIDTTQNTNITNASTYANSAFAKANTAGVGTVTSVATGNGLSGGTITSTGTLVVACPSHNTVGSYCMGGVKGAVSTAMTVTFGTNYSAGATLGSNVQGIAMGGVYTSDTPPGFNQPGPNSTENVLSGTWKWMNPTITMPADGRYYTYGLLCRVS
jgi:hypothetical protein